MEVNNSKFNDVSNAFLLQDALAGTEIPYLHLSPPFETCSVDLDVYGNPKCFSAIK